MSIHNLSPLNGTVLGKGVQRPTIGVRHGASTSLPQSQLSCLYLQLLFIYLNFSDAVADWPRYKNIRVAKVWQ